MRALLAVPLALGLVAASCAEVGSSERGAVAPVAPTGQASFRAWETGWLEELAGADPRLALRMKDKPRAEVLEKLAAGAVIRGNSDVGVVGGALDLFSFDERARELHRLREELRAAPDDGTMETKTEKRLLEHLVASEELRVAVERETPESASERVRAIVETWGRPGTPREVDEREHLVARGLRVVVADVKEGRLSAARGLELEDALDTLERLAVPEGYPLATQAITSLRVELGKVHPRGAARSSSVPLAARLLASLGVSEGLEDLAVRLGQEEASLRLDATSRLARFPEHTVNDALTAAASHVDVATSCPTRETVSKVRAMAPPPERALVCAPLTLVASATTPVEDAVAAVTLHDDVAIALWTLGLERGATDLDATRTAHPLLASVPPERQDRLVRSALVSPLATLGAGLAASLLDADGEGGVEGRRDRATRWLAFGDAPFDIVSEALSRPAESKP